MTRIKKDVTGQSSWTLRTTNSSRKIDEWTFVSPFDKEESIKIDVRMVSEEGRLLFSATALKGKWFKSDEMKVWRSESIDELRQMVSHDLNDIVRISGGVVWENWLEVVVHGASGETFSPFSGHSGKKKSIYLEYSEIKRGTHPDFPGRLFRLGQQNTAIRFPSPKRAGQWDPDYPTPEESGKDWARSVGAREIEKEYSYIPDTPENRESLDRIIHAMTDLQSRLSDFLSQDRAQEFLISVSNGMKALPDHSAHKP